MAQNRTTPVVLSDAVKRVFEPRAGRALSHEDVREIRANLAGFFDTLAGWQRASDARESAEATSESNADG